MIINSKIVYFLTLIIELWNTSNLGPGNLVPGKVGPGNFGPLLNIELERIFSLALCF